MVVPWRVVLGWSSSVGAWRSAWRGGSCLVVTGSCVPNYRNREISDFSGKRERRNYEIAWPLHRARSRLGSGGRSAVLKLLDGDGADAEGARGPGL